MYLPVNVKVRMQDWPSDSQQVSWTPVPLSRELGVSAHGLGSQELWELALKSLSLQLSTQSTGSPRAPLLVRLPQCSAWTAPTNGYSEKE